MFILSKLKDITSISPILFDKNFNETIKEYINKKYANKIIYNLGLVISLWDILKFEDTHLLPNDPNAHTRAYFRLVIFSPFIDEIIIGKIKTFTRDGVYVTLGFFDDIIIPAENLQTPSHFDEKEQTWYWEYKMEEQDEMEIQSADNDSTQKQPHKLFMDSGEEIRFRVTDKIFIDQYVNQNNPTINTNPTNSQTLQQQSESSVVHTSNMPAFLGSNPAPFTIIGSINEPGLGLLNWWS